MKITIRDRKKSMRQLALKQFQYSIFFMLDFFSTFKLSLLHPTKDTLED